MTHATTRPRGFRPMLLGWAVALGLAAQVPVLAFGLHFSLWIAQLTGESRRMYWALAGALWVAGIALGLAVVPWHRLTVRLICAAVVLTLFGVWGAARA